MKYIIHQVYTHSETCLSYFCKKKIAQNNVTNLFVKIKIQYLDYNCWHCEGIYNCYFKISLKFNFLGTRNRVAP
jgi:hypothetical protein